MGNGRRLVLLLVGFVFFFAAYQVYDYFLGRYDGLPPLPAEYRYVPGESAQAVIRPPRFSPAVERLRQAFGENCAEQHRRIKLEWRSQGIVLAADSYQLLDNGQVRLTRVSVAFFGKDRGDGNQVEINTIRGEQADIEFDRPIVDLFRDAAERRPIGGKLQGLGDRKVHIRNNRRTRRPDDDIHVYTDWLAYRNADHRIWTDAEVRLVDGDPAQATVTATGLEIILAAEENKTADRTRRKRPTITGVRYVRLHRDVCMDLVIDAEAAFLGQGMKASERSGSPGKGTEADNRPDTGRKGKPKQSPVVVTSRGPFVYHVSDDKDNPVDRAEFSDRVSVIRKHDAPTPEDSGPEAIAAVYYDQLDCDRLVLEFRRGANDDKAFLEGGKTGLDLIRATASGRQVELVSDAEKLHATGTDLVYDRSSNRTMLIGDPVQAEQDGHQIRLRGRLVFVNPAKGQKEITDAIAEGPGQIQMRTDKAGVTRTASWSKAMRISKDGPLQRLDFRGTAAFEDSERGRLQADRIMVWLEARRRETAPKPSEGDPTATGGYVPKRMEAVGNVALRSPDLVIQHATNLSIAVESVEKREKTARKRRPDGASTTAPVRSTNASPMPFEPSDRDASPLSDSPLTARPEFLPPARKSPKRPLEVIADVIEVELAYDGERTELHHVHTHGRVHVVQRSADGDGNAIQLTGDRLDLRHSAKGSKLRVVGSELQPALVQLETLRIMGPEVNIDQMENKAWVNGGGSLSMPSRTDFQGAPLDKPVEVVIYWNERMYFDGKYAEFAGNVQADQDNARLTCGTLQVVLDRYVSLQETKRDGKQVPAALDRMLCDQRVTLQNGIREGDKWVEYQRIEGQEVAFDNPSAELNVKGPGALYVLQTGNPADGPFRPPSEPSANRVRDSAKKPSSRMMLTRIRFHGTMQASRANGVVVFLEDVELVHIPADDPDVRIDLDRLPKDGLLLRCGMLKGLNPRMSDRTTTQVFEANYQVRVHAREFFAQADKVKYDESKDLLILVGQGGNLARLWRQKAPGTPPEEIRAKKVWYWRKQNKVRFDETDTIKVNR